MQAKDTSVNVLILCRLPPDSALDHMLKLSAGMEIHVLQSTNQTIKTIISQHKTEDSVTEFGTY